ncbi:MAG: hypothetical protein RIG68_28235 [Imperialibacter sp.]|uniref:hypothetical protein n=1 Tax=Imperialibacter sp. TaxID=2038411 RepID=UPI0032EE63DE
MDGSHRLSRKDAHHFAKEVTIDHGRLIAEEDSYNKFNNDSVSSRLIYLYSFGSKTWDCKLITHYYRAFPPSVSEQLDLAEADSVLNSWGLSRN